MPGANHLLTMRVLRTYIRKLNCPQVPRARHQWTMICFEQSGCVERSTLVVPPFVWGILAQAFGFSTQSSPLDVAMQHGSTATIVEDISYPPADATEHGSKHAQLHRTWKSSRRTISCIQKPISKYFTRRHTALCATESKRRTTSNGSKAPRRFPRDTTRATLESRR